MAVGMVGAVALPIPPTEAIAVAAIIGWEPLDFLRVIAEADDLYVERVNQRNRT